MHFPPIFFSMFLVGGALGVLAHEGGHWILGRLLGLDVVGVSIGSGPLLYRGRWRATAVELRLYPSNGAVRIMPQPKEHGLAYGLFTLGGIAGNVGLLAIIALSTSGPTTPLVDAIAPGLVWPQILIIATSVLPYRVEGAESDGLRLIRLARGWRPYAADAFAKEACVYRLKGDPPAAAFSLRLLRLCRRFDAGADRSGAARRLLRELDRGKARRDETLLVLDKLITRHLLHGDIGLDGRLDELSRRALDLAPAIATLRGSRGACLVVLGRYAEGKALLAPLAEGEPSFDTIVSRLFLARAEHGLGAEPEARRLVEAARAAAAFASIPGISELLHSVEAEIGNGSVPAARVAPARAPC